MAQAGRKRTPQEIAKNLDTLKQAGRSWLIDSAILAVLIHLINGARYVPFLYLGIGLGYITVSYLLLRGGHTERLADPTVSFPQLAIALTNQCLGLWLAPQAGVFFLLNIFQVMGFGLFALNVKGFRVLLFIAIGEMFLVIASVGQQISFPTGSLAGQAMLFLVFAISLQRFVWVASYIAGLRSRIWAKNSELKESEARFRALADLSSDWYWEQDADLRFTRVASGKDSKVLPQHALVGKRLWESEFATDLPGGWDALRAIQSRFEDFRDVVVRRTSDDNHEYFLSLSGGPIIDHDGRFKGYRGVAREVTNQKLAEKRVEYMATHDVLTGLPNRHMFSQMLSRSIDAARRYDRRFGLLFVDLDGFKLVNDALGHEAGDALLREISARFVHTLRSTDIVARLGGDEFVVLVPEIESPAQVAAVARKLLAASTVPFKLSGQEREVSASIGIAMFPEDGSDEPALLKNADSAMYFAKESGKNRFQFHSGFIEDQSAHATDPADPCRRRGDPCTSP